MAQSSSVMIMQVSGHIGAGRSLCGKFQAVSTNTIRSLLLLKYRLFQAQLTATRHYWSLVVHMIANKVPHTRKNVILRSHL